MHAANPYLQSQEAGQGAPRLGEGVMLYGPQHSHVLPNQSLLPPSDVEQGEMPPAQSMYQQPQEAYSWLPVDEHGVSLSPGHLHAQNPVSSNPKTPDEGVGNTS